MLIKNYLLIVLIFIIPSTSFSQKVNDFELENTSGDLVSYSEIKGSKLTVIDFWATWCKPCVKAMPKLNTMFQKYEDQGLAVIGISCDGPRSISKVAPLISSLQIDYPVLKDIDCEIMDQYQFQAFPTLIILDDKDEIVWVHEGFSAGDETIIEQAIGLRLK